MIFFAIGLLIILFTKEFILINQELIIYITFLSITLICIQSFSFLRKTFENVQNDIKNNLITLSLNSQKVEQTLIQKAELTSNFLNFIEFNLPENVDLPEAELN